MADLLATRGLRTARALGQHFLLDPGILEAIVDAGEVGPGDRVVEIGTGAGTLTRVLAGRAGFVRTVDIDGRMLDLARELLVDGGHVDPTRIAFHHGDCLAGKRSLEPALARALEEDAARHPDLAEKWVANLPYHVSGPLIAILLSARRRVRRIAVTIQREMAERLTAGPGTSDYGPLAILATLACREVRRVSSLPPGAFHPPPRVHSSVLVLDLDPDRPDLSELAARLPLLFSQRRKTLAHAIHKAFRHTPSAAHVAEAIGGLGIDPSARAETLEAGDILRLAPLLSPDPDSTISHEEPSS